MTALKASGVSHHYGEFKALSDLTLEVSTGEIFALLGPNGSGKTTLFRLASTIAKLQQGELTIFGQSVVSQQHAVRSLLGIVFQSPSLDPKLTAVENIRCQAALYGVRGTQLSQRIDEVAGQLGIADRLNTVVEKLSGGLKRRVELAKGILHRPKLLLLDEPSTGLDPAARLDLWHALEQLRQASGVTVLLTTHLLEEADKADRIAILHRGSVVAVGAPQQLRADLGSQVLTIQSPELETIAAWLTERKVVTQLLSQQLRVVGSNNAALMSQLAAQFGDRIQTLTLGQPKLEDVFIARTGHQYWMQTET